MASAEEAQEDASEWWAAKQSHAREMASLHTQLAEATAAVAAATAQRSADAETHESVVTSLQARLEEVTTALEAATAQRNADAAAHVQAMAELREDVAAGMHAYPSQQLHSSYDGCAFKLLHPHFRFTCVLDDSKNYSPLPF